MKWIIIFIALVIVLFFSCSAQVPNDSQRIVGTWAGVDRVNDPVTNFIFNTNGTVSGFVSGSYFSSDSTIIIRSSNRVWTSTYHLSDDGRILVLMQGGQLAPYWFEKQ